MTQKKLVPALVLALAFGWAAWLGKLPLGKRSPASIPSAGYCLAIRGNGELMPAHWGSAAQAIEAFGIPSAIGGGSSASITTFLLESVSLNPLLAGANRELRAAFLVKSFQGFMYGIGDRPGWKDLLGVLKTLTAPQGSKKIALAALLEQINSKNLPGQLGNLLQALDDVGASRVYLGPGVERVRSLAKEMNTRPSVEGFQRLSFAIHELKASFAVLGAFDAKNDANLFIRDGVVSFPELARLFGRMGDFYALAGASTETISLAEKYLDSCATGSTGKKWLEITEQNQACQKDLEQLVDRYFAETNGQQFRIQEHVGDHIPALISTSVVRGDSAKALEALKEEYLRKGDRQAGQRMHLRSEDVVYGYFGKASDLEAVDAGLSDPAFPGGKSKIDKSRRFFALGPASWQEALSISPAEPGLSSFVPFEAKGEKLISLGGWSDLHPIPVLKAMGCQSVAYLTRVGGDSVFGQGVAKRVFQLDDIPWERLDSANKSTVISNNNGDPSNLAGGWAARFNPANPHSSYSVSIAMADAVVCSHWDDFDVKTQFTKMIESAYAAPFFLHRPWRNFLLREPKQISEADNAMDPGLGYRPYVGCIPLSR